MHYYFRDAYENELCAEFDDLIRTYPDIHFFQPSPDKAPWHVQAAIDTGGDNIVLNFWPHKMKGNRDGSHSVEGGLALRALIDAAIADRSGASDDPGAFDLFEK